MSRRAGTLRGVLLLLLLLPAPAIASTPEGAGDGPQQVIDRTVVEVLAVMAVMEVMAVMAVMAGWSRQWECGSNDWVSTFPFLSVWYQHSR